MDAMRGAIAKRRAKLAGDIDYDDMKNANVNPDEGSNDDLNIQNIQSQENDADGLAPELAADSMDEAGNMSFSPSMEAPAPEEEDQESRINKFFSKDDVDKPGIRGKAANKMMAALNKLKGN